MRISFLVLAALIFSGCYRTHYVNFSPEGPHTVEAEQLPTPESGWQSFFVWGWAPGVKRIDARDQCHGEEYVTAIRTERTFLQGLVAAFAGYYINIYSPWNGEVYCDEDSS